MVHGSLGMATKYRYVCYIRRTQNYSIIKEILKSAAYLPTYILLLTNSFRFNNECGAPPLVGA